MEIIFIITEYIKFAKLNHTNGIPNGSLSNPSFDTHVNIQNTHTANR